MEKILNYMIDEKSNNMTVEEFLRVMGYSKNLIIHLRNTPMGISINNNLVYTTHRLLTDEVLKIHIIEKETSSNIVPVPMELNIVYEDDDILIINKESGVPIHPSQGNYDNTLANGIAYYFQQKNEAVVYRAINRLDRDTTGLLILAKNMLSACILSSMVKERSIHREYLAIASGKTTDSGTITAPISRVCGSTIERCVSECGDYACTHYKTVCYNAGLDLSLVHLRLETGRTHQIRVHMKHINHPLPGDFLYNPDFSVIKRQALHSFRLSFIHPITKKPLKFEAPLPADMQLFN